MRQLGDGSRRAALALLLVGVVSTAAAQEHDHRVSVTDEAPVPMSTTCRSTVAGLLDRAVDHLHRAAYTDAVVMFRQAAHSDVDCTMAYWGAAMAHWGRWLDTGRTDALADGWRAIDSADLLHRRPSNREQRYLEAVRVQYRERLGDGAARAATLLVRLAEEAPGDVHARFFAAAAASCVPLDGGGEALVMRQNALRLLAGAGPAAHSVAGLRYAVVVGDVPQLAGEVLPQARALAALPVASPFLSHVPSHVFMHLGLWDEAIASNRRAVDAAALARSPADELHALDALSLALVQAGRVDEARLVAVRIAGGYLAEVPGEAAAHERASIVARVAIERGGGAAAVETEGGDHAAWTAPPVAASVQLHTMRQIRRPPLSRRGRPPQAPRSPYLANGLAVQPLTAGVPRTALTSSLPVDDADCRAPEGPLG